MKKITIEGFSYKQGAPAHRFLTWRVYGSRTKNSWEAVAEFQITVSGGSVSWPSLELEPTGPRSFRSYNLVPVDEAGHERWHDDNDLVLPRTLPREFGGRLDVAEWMLYNLELKGEIAPGQCRL